MRLTPQRNRVIDSLRTYGPMDMEAMLSRIGGGKRNLNAVIKGLIAEDAVTLRDGSLRLTPTGYMAVGSFPPKVEAGHE